jgi:predicted phage baseplate assembly protein
MALAAPNLDDRTFQEIVYEAKRRIPAFIDGWSDHNVSDPGITLIELFAWMTEMILYRQNQVPRRLTIKMMELLGISLEEPRAATAPITFWLSQPLPEAIRIPAGTEVASTQTESQPSVIFTTIRDLAIEPPALVRVLTRGQNREQPYQDHSVHHLQAGGEEITLFSQNPRPDDAVYFGFAEENDLSHHLLGFQFDCVEGAGVGIDETLPPYRWEAAVSEEAGEITWEPCAVDAGEDETRGLNVSGRIRVHLPQITAVTLNEQKQKLHWLRLRIIHPDDFPSSDVQMRGYSQSPSIRQVTVASWGGTTPAVQAELIQREFLGYSGGSPGQRLQLQNWPILKPRPELQETLVVQMPNSEAEQPWQRRSDFANSKMGDRHYTLDTATGEIQLPPAQPLPNGTVRIYGAIPPRGAALWFHQYRHGGGHSGNLPAHKLDTLKTAIPYVGRVRNRTAAQGGQDQESLEVAMLRAPHLLHARSRAVTATDYEFLATQVSDVVVGRVKCLQVEPGRTEVVAPGVVYVLVLPVVPRPEDRLLRPQLQMPAEDLQKIETHLDKRRLLTTRLRVQQPELHWVSVRVNCRLTRGADKKAVNDEILRRLYRFLNPFTGGSEAKGWPFGRDLHEYDVYHCLQGLPDVLAILDITLREPRPDGERRNVGETVRVTSHGVIVSDLHEVVFVR